MNFSSLRETGEALSEVVNQCIDIAREKYGITIYALITDNASNMKSMGRQVNLWHVTCNSHSGNLRCKSVANKDFCAKVQKVQLEFKSPASETSIVAKGGNKIVLAGETRWCSNRDGCKNCLKSYRFMMKIIDNDEFPVKDDIKVILRDPTFEFQLIDNILIMDPVCELINVCKANGSNIADATELWLKLDIPALDENHQLLLQGRISKVITPYGLAANLLHPAYRGLRFDNNELYKTMMRNFFQTEFTEEGLIQLEHYQNQTYRFQRLFENNYRSWSLFWRVAGLFYKELSVLAIKLLKIPASTGELERLFSQWSYIHSTKHCHLIYERSAKLIFLY